MQAFNIEDATVVIAEMPPATIICFREVTLSPWEVQDIFGKITAHQIWAGRNKN